MKKDSRAAPFFGWSGRATEGATRSRPKHLSLTVARPPRASLFLRHVRRFLLPDFGDPCIQAPQRISVFLMFFQYFHYRRYLYEVYSVGLSIGFNLQLSLKLGFCARYGAP